MTSKKHASEPEPQPQAQPLTDTSNVSTGGNTTEERAANAINPGLPGSVDEGPKTRAQEHFGNTAVSDQSVDPERPLYGEEPGEGGMGRAVSPMQGQAYFNQDEAAADPRNRPPGAARGEGTAPDENPSQDRTGRTAGYGRGTYPGAPADPAEDQPQE